RAVALVALVFLLLAPFTPVVEWLAVRFAVPARIERADAIVVLGGGRQGEHQLSDPSLRRTIAGIRLYRRGLAPVLVFSGGGPPGVTEAEVIAATAREVGVPPADFRLETASTNTCPQDIEVARVLSPAARHRILLVPDP